MGAGNKASLKKEKELTFSASSFLRYCQPHKPEKWSGVSQLACLPMFCFVFVNLLQNLVISGLKFL